MMLMMLLCCLIFRAFCFHPYCADSSFSLATMSERWKKPSIYKHNRDCVEEALKHWLLVHDTLFDDLQYIKNALLVPYELLTLGDTKGL